jgi:Flp pilus assembly protein TadD
MSSSLINDKLTYFEYNAAFRHLLGQIALLQKDPETAARLFSEARLLAPDDDALLEELAWAQFEADQFARCLESVKQLHRLSRDKRDDLLHLEARCLAVLERSAEARDLYIKLSRKSPTDVNVWIELGMIAWELGDFRRVATSSVRVIALDPHRYEGYMLKALNEDHHGNKVNALRLMKQATDRSPDEAMPYLLLGRMFEQGGQQKRARIAYLKALQVEPDNAEARLLIDARQLSAVDG